MKKPKAEVVPATSSDTEDDTKPESQTIIRREMRAEWSGPLPPPSTLRAFDELVENGAERIFSQFETEAEHRRKMESAVVKQDGRERTVAQVLAGLFALGALGVSLYALSVGAHTTAGIIGGGSIAMVVAAFLGKRLWGEQDE